jgi:hypothetical protein
MGNKLKAKPKYWKQHHDNLNEAQKLDARKKTMSALEWSEPTFYRKMRENEGLKNYERILICTAYGVTVADFFPESDLVKPVSKKKAKAA